MQVQFTRHAGLALALAAGATLGACKGRRAAPGVPESAAGAVGAPAMPGSASADTSTMSDTSSMNPDTTSQMGGNASASLANLTDVNYAALVDEANKADSTAGALAAKKGTKASVKAFGKRMMGEHHALRLQDQKLVKQLNITPQAPANDPVQQLASQEMQALQSAPKGAAFDSTYIDNEVKAHKAVLGLLNAIDANGQNAQLKALAKKATPIIQSHLDRAQSIQKSLTAAT
ncbi:MAG TPA: DUF4142 domain-containing protein [Gemmatimonadaceae bacterium]|nr:DUF4142 domain-containing protein [Gemmatimonadaceae bacterium]